MEVIVWFFFRLDAYERNKNLGKSDVKEPNFYITLPDTDINADHTFIEVKIETFSNFLDQFGKTLDSKIKLLYKERFLQFFQSCQCC